MAEEHHLTGEALSCDVQEMAIGDMPAIMEIERGSFTTPWSRSLFMQEYHSERSKIFIAATGRESGRRVIGYICAWFVEDELHILNLAAHPLFRRRKVATGLLAHCLAFSAARGVRRAFLEVRQSNEQALSLYGRHGFKPVGRRKGYYTDTREDAIIMMLEMEPSHSPGNPSR